MKVLSFLECKCHSLHHCWHHFWC